MKKEKAPPEKNTRKTQLNLKLQRGFLWKYILSYENGSKQSRRPSRGCDFKRQQCKKVKKVAISQK
jgi:hypothetical protein